MALERLIKKSKKFNPVYILFPLIFFYLFIDYNRGFNFYDEGLAVYGGFRVLNGDIPHRDFWSLYPPGNFYALAALFKLFGHSLVAVRILSVSMLALLSFSVYLVAGKLVSKKLSIFSWILTAAWLGTFNYTGNPIPPALIFCMFSCHCFLGFLQNNSRKSLFISGLMVACAALFRHDLGFYTLFSEMLTLIFYIYTVYSSEPHKKEWKNVAKTMGVYIGGLLIVLLPLTVYFIVNVPFFELINNLVIFPLTIYPKTRAIPYPALFPAIKKVFSENFSTISYLKLLLTEHIPFYFPIIIGLLSVILLVKDRQSRSKGAIVFWGLLLFTIQGVLFLNYSRVRSDIPHLLPVYISTFILFAIIISNSSHIIRSVVCKHVFTGLVAVLAILIVLVPVHGRIKSYIDNKSAPSILSVELAGAKGIFIPWSGHVYNKAINFIVDNVPEKERIFVGNAAHDNIFANDVMFYFLSRRHSATRYHELHPGHATTETIQKEIVNELIKYDVRYVVLFYLNVPGPGINDKGSLVLDNFIRANFRKIREFGPYVILKKEKI